MSGITAYDERSPPLVSVCNYKSEPKGDQDDL